MAMMGSLAHHFEDRNDDDVDEHIMNERYELVTDQAFKPLVFQE